MSLLSPHWLTLVNPSLQLLPRRLSVHLGLEILWLPKGLTLKYIVLGAISFSTRKLLKFVDALDPLLFYMGEEF